jgi:hypothetical protein
MGKKRPADAGAAQVRTARAGQRPSVAPQAGVERHRFGNSPKALLGLIVVLGIFTTGWFVSNIYSNLKLAANTKEAGPQADAAQPPQAVRASQTMPPESQPVAAVPSQAPAPVTHETAASAGTGIDAAAVSSRQVARPSAAELPPPIASEPKENPSENIVSRAKPAEPEPAVRGEKEAKPVKKGRPELKINAIAWRTDEPKAIVNMQRVYVGDVIEGATVLEIQRKRILLEYDGEPFEIRF